jgi:hypothetical protein
MKITFLCVRRDCVRRVLRNEQRSNAYRDFLQLWSGADAQIPLLLRVKAELAEFETTGGT